eukprot:TRINITY_DN1413_c0_g1_i2.p1 TRINITY_DN1413_c0_g1~~TRINITY_DN1413_c0_g1_i2.p1  ORF type:complete len:371 (+),score=81.68 TRINITY_DN1413_c0_g1_i2:3-1115(+)
MCIRDSQRRVREKFFVEPSRRMEKYEKGKEVGAGTYGVVYRATSKETKKVVAMKKIRMGNHKEGIQFTAIREIKILKEMHHENILGLLDVFSRKSNVFLILEFMEYNLEQIVNDMDIMLQAADIKSYMQMLLRGVEQLHLNWILHRDLKPNNLLIGPDGVLKLADFGLAKSFGSPDPKFTPTVVTRWYRAPELLFGAKAYGTGIDIWSVGCIFAELMHRTPYFTGDSDIDQLGKIFSALGTPTEEIWPGMSSLPGYALYDYSPPNTFRQLFPAASDDALDLISQMLRYNPNTRITATEALKHRYFQTFPLPTNPRDLPKSKMTSEQASRMNMSPPIKSPSKRPLESPSEGPPARVRKLTDDDNVKRKLFT